MGLIDLFKSAMLGSSAGGLGDDIAKMTRNVSGSEVGEGLPAAMQAGQEPAFGEMIGKLFGGLSPTLQAGMLNQVLALVGPATLSGLAGGLLGKLMAPGQTQLTPEQAAQVSPEAAAEIVNHAQKESPGLLEKLATFYGENTALVNTMGAAGATFLAAKISEIQRKE